MIQAIKRSSHENHPTLCITKRVPKENSKKKPTIALTRFSPNIFMRSTIVTTASAPRWMRRVKRDEKTFIQ